MVKKLGFVFLSQHWVPQKFFGGPQFGHACHRGLRILPTVRVKHDRTIQISSSVEKSLKKSRILLFQYEKHN